MVGAYGGSVWWERMVGAYGGSVWWERMWERMVGAYGGSVWWERMVGPYVRASNMDKVMHFNYCYINID